MMEVLVIHVASAGETRVHQNPRSHSPVWRPLLVYLRPVQRSFTMLRVMTFSTMMSSAVLTSEGSNEGHVKGVKKICGRSWL